MGKNHQKALLVATFKQKFPLCSCLVLSLRSMKTNVLNFFGLAKVLLLWMKMTYPSLFDL